MTDSDSRLVENLLAQPDVHRQWAGGYRTRDNEAFFERAFDLITRELNPPAGATFLDAGCGSCAHTVRLARRGFNVRAVDFSESALEMARGHLKEAGLDERISLQREDLTRLSFPDASFDYVLCWGVLMHVPDVARAVAELARVLRPGGTLVVSEGNMHSLEAVTLRGLKRLLGRERADVKETPAGVEYWKERGGGALVTRQANVNWLVESFESHGLRLSKRVAGQFSESYAMVSAPALKRLVHGFNNFWFGTVRAPGLAYGNLLFLRKPE
jgi:ubiquinone/menaquinone biosynthesis C-methylase UbiE